MSIKQKLLNNSTIKLSSVLNESMFFESKDTIPTSIPMINVALSGSLKGGLTPGLTMLAGPSKHYKSSFALILASAYLQKYNDGVVLFYDSEFGTPNEYFKKFAIDTNNVIHTPITDVEQLKHDIISQLQQIDRDDHVCIIIDSIGNLASKKEVDDAIDGKSVADMSRAKQIKSLFRMVTPHLTIKDIPMVVVNHTYKEIGMFPKDIVGGGTGSYYSSDNIWIVGRQQEKEGQDVVGYNFIINIEKSRFVKEKSKIPITVSHGGGVSKYSGLFDVATEGGFIKEQSKGWYSVGDSQKRRKADLINDEQLWNDLIADDEFNNYIETKYKL